VFVPSAGPLNQGDILIAPIARVCAADYFVPDRWDRVDQASRLTTDLDALIVLGLFVRAGTGHAGTGDDPCKVPATTVPVELTPPVTECRGGC